jgi:hypothetical protein
MSTLSANQLYNLSGAEKQGTKFKDWFNREKEQYQAKINSGKITGKMPFPEWLTKRWKVKSTMMNAEGETFGSKITEALKNVGAQVLNKTVGSGAQTSSGTTSGTTGGGIPPGQPLQEKRILGMKPIVAYSVGGVLLLTATVATILIIRKAKKAA